MLPFALFFDSRVFTVTEFDVHVKMNAWASREIEMIRCVSVCVCVCFAWKFNALTFFIFPIYAKSYLFLYQNKSYPIFWRWRASLFPPQLCVKGCI